MKIFCTFPTVNISKLNFWLVICIAKNFIWTTLKVIFFGEKNHLLNPKQFGFWPKYSTEMAICHFIDNIKSSLDQGKVVGAVFLELKKAFDTVNHVVLINKLKQMNFSQQALNWFKSYLDCRQQCVKINGVKSSLQKCKLGVPQGSILGPLLFCLYINDLPESCKEVDCQMYADDTIIYVTAESSHMAAEMLTSQLVCISQWLQDNGLTLNYTKTVSMCFSLKNKALDVFKIKIEQKEIKEVSEFKYLGVIVDSKLKFDAHIKKMSKTIKTNLNCFRMIRPCISLKAAQRFMHAMILSHMIIWGQASQSVVKPVMSLYKQTLKVMDQKPMKWHHCQILQRYNLLSFDNLLKFSFIKTVFKCIHGLAPNIVCQWIQKLSSDGAKTRGGSKWGL